MRRNFDEFQNIVSESGLPKIFKIAMLTNKDSEDAVRVIHDLRRSDINALATIPERGLLSLFSHAVVAFD